MYCKSHLDLCMANRRVIAIVLYLVFRQLAVANGQHIHTKVIVAVSRHNCSHCTNTSANLANKCCLTIDELSDYIPPKGSIRLIFEHKTEFFEVKKTLVFQNLKNLEITGSTNPNTILNCAGEDTGLTFDNINSIELTNVKIERCGAKHVNSIIDERGKPKPMNFSSALIFKRCSKVSLNNTFVSHSNGFGVVIYPIAGSITLQRCTFEKNFLTQDTGQSVGGGGLYIDFNNHDYSVSSIEHSSVTIHISKCIFNKNHAKAIPEAKIENAMSGQGGGIVSAHRRILGMASVVCVLVKICISGISLYKLDTDKLISVAFGDISTSGHYINITHCIVSNNTAQWGGGLSIMSTNGSTNNTVSVSDSEFSRNTASKGGGGTILYLKCIHPTPNSCSINKVHIEFKNCNIIENFAKHGGGGSTFVLKTAHTTDSYTNTILLESCRWSKNGANLYGAAIDITTGFITRNKLRTVPQFSNCYFEGNYPQLKQKDGAIQDGRGALMITSSSIRFKGSVTFINNNGSAVYAITSQIQICNNSHISFTNNIGRNGGALALLTSYLYIQKSVYIRFSNNQAFVKGGAIYSNVGQLGPHKVPPYNCFLQSKHGKEKHSIRLIFERNKAECGMSIYTTSLRSCVTQKLNDLDKKNISIILNKIANFEFLENVIYPHVITSGIKLTIDKKSSLNAIPGKKFKLNVKAVDEFGQPVQSKYRVYIPASENCSIVVDDFKSLPNNKLKLYGTPGDSCNISIEMEGSRVMHILQKVTLAPCPPGLILRQNTTIISCTCPSNYTEGYPWINKCDKKKFEAHIVQGMWTGYTNTESDESLQVAYCPPNFCSQNSSALPGSGNKILLDEFICRNGRTGVLCGKCRKYYSVYYHSPSYNCIDSKLCSFGWLFYILSELIPLITIFTLILKFNISFTSGALTGFLFYAQIIDILDVAVTSQDETYPKWTVYLIEASNLVYGFFSLNPFNQESLSFCLWERANTLDIITFKFVTIAFAFCLILLFYLFINFNPRRRRCRLSIALKVSTKQSLVHGITAFLVICLVQTIKVTFYIFSSAQLYKKGSIGTKYCVYYQGDLDYFEPEHLRYILPATLIATIIVVIPTLLLLWYPQGPKLLSKCGLNETKLIQKSEKLLLINRLKPVIDSFQGCYKDKFRFFAGLLFLYRITILANISVFSIGFTFTYAMVQAQLTVMLLIHALAQPYKKKIHNILDSLLLSNLALTNMATIFIRHGTMLSYQYTTSIVAAFQALLTIVPLLCFLFLICKATLPKIIRKRICIKHTKYEENAETDIPFRLLND